MHGEAKQTSSETPEVQIQYDENGFVKNYVCPICGGKVKLDHTDDIGTKFFKCKKCGEQSSKLKSAKRKEWEKGIKPEVLAHLNRIEDPSLAGKPLLVEAVVSSTSTAYFVPKALEITYEETKGDPETLNIIIPKVDPVNIKFVRISDEVKYNRLKRHFARGKSVVRIEELGHRTVYRIRIRPQVFTLEKHGEKIVDAETGFEYKAYDVYVVAEKDMVFEPSSLIRLEGICVPNPRTQKTTLIIYRVETPGKVSFFDVEKLKQLKTIFQNKTVKERFEWILDNFECYSQIVGRRNLAKAGFLLFFTPVWINFNAEIQKGWGNGLFIGDTTTAKTETLRKLIRLLRAGMLITAETASTVGLTGTATQIEKEGWFVDWGFLVLCDQKLLAVDGAHKLSLSNWAALAESERTGVVSIAKAAKDTAYARTRQIKVANPIDREERSKFATRTLASFLYPCQALASVFDKTSIARLDLAVFSDQRDVAAKDINKPLDSKYDENLHLMSEVLKWCWSNQAEVKFTKEATDAILKEATELHNTFFAESIPLVSIDMKWKLARLSAACANATLSTDDFKSVMVTKEHVEEVAGFLKDEYSKAGLNTFAQAEKFEVLTKEDVTLIINNIINETKGVLTSEIIEKIFEFIVLHGRVTRDQLITKFNLQERKQLRPLLAMLRNEKLVSSGRGLYATPKLVQAYKTLNPAKIAKITNLPEGPPKEKQTHACTQKVGGSSQDLVYLGYLGNIKPLDPFEHDQCATCGKEQNLTHKLLKDGSPQKLCSACAYLHSHFQKGTQYAFECVAKDACLTQKEAEQRFWQFVEEQKLGRDEEGLWQWTI